MHRVPFQGLSCWPPQHLFQKHFIGRLHLFPVMTTSLMPGTPGTSTWELVPDATFLDDIQPSQSIKRASARSVRSATPTSSSLPYNLAAALLASRNAAWQVLFSSLSCAIQSPSFLHSSQRNLGARTRKCTVMHGHKRQSPMNLAHKESYGWLSCTWCPTDDGNQLLSSMPVPLLGKHCHVRAMSRSSGDAAWHVKWPLTSPAVTQGYLVHWYIYENIADVAWGIRIEAKRDLPRLPCGWWHLEGQLQTLSGQQRKIPSRCQIDFWKARLHWALGSAIA